MLFSESSGVPLRNKLFRKFWTLKKRYFVCRFYEVTKLIEQFKDILHQANLLPKIEDETLSSAERVIRHGELKQLKSLRYQLKTESKSKNRKQLKYEMYNFADKDKEAKETDIRDVEFRISNDYKRYVIFFKNNFFN